MQEKKEITRLSKINKKSKALRSAIPRRISDALKLEANDFLEWKLDGTEARVRKVILK